MLRRGKPRNVSTRTRIAYHEAGHAVLSAAIADRPQHVSIRPDGPSLGRSGARKSARPTSRVQVHLAGFAAEHILTGRRSRQLAQEVGFAILSCLAPKLGEAFAGTEHHDGHRAVQEVLKLGTVGTDDEIRGEIDRFYEIARESLSSVWPAVAAMAKALLKSEELYRDGMDAVLGGIDIFTPVFAVQQVHGLREKG